MIHSKAERLHYWSILIAQVILLFVAEAMKMHPWLRPVFALMMLLVFGSVITAIWSDKKAPRILALVVGGVAILFGAIGHAVTGTLLTMHFVYQPGHPVDWVLAVSMGSYGLFVAISIFSIGRHIFGHDKVTSNVIAGGVCIYMLLGMFFAFVYVVMALIIPDVFLVSGSGSLDLSLTDYFYFSYSVLTTTGFGDITVSNGLARVIAIIEAASGCLYIAIMIAGLVGTYFIDRKSRH